MNNKFENVVKSIELGTLIASGPLYTPIYEGLIQASVSELTPIEPILYSKWITKGIISSLNKWGIAAFTRSLPLVYCMNVQYFITNKQLDKFVTEYTTDEEVRAIENSPNRTEELLKKFLKLFARKTILNLVTLPISGLIVLYSTDTGIVPKYDGVIDLLKKVFNDESLLKAITIGAKFRIARSLLCSAFDTLALYLRLKKPNEQARRHPRYNFLLTNVLPNLFVVGPLFVLENRSIVNMAAGGAALSFAELFTNPTRYFVNEYRIIMLAWGIFDFFVLQGATQ